MSNIVSHSGIDHHNMSQDYGNQLSNTIVNQLNDTISQIVVHNDQFNQNNNENNNDEYNNNQRQRMNIQDELVMIQNNEIIFHQNQINQLAVQRIRNQQRNNLNSSSYNNNNNNSILQNGNQNSLALRRNPQNQQQSTSIIQINNPSNSLISIQQNQRRANNALVEQIQQQIQQQQQQQQEQQNDNILNEFNNNNVQINQDGYDYNNMNTYNQWFNSMIVNQGLLCLTLFMLLSSFTQSGVDPIYAVLSLSIYFLLDFFKLLKQLKIQKEKKTITLIRFEIIEDILFLFTATIICLFFKTKQFSFLISVVPISITCILRYCIYTINRKQNDCISFIDFLIISFRILLIVQIVNISLKMNGDIEWAWGEVFWVYWVFFSIICGLVFGLFIMSLTKICQIFQGEVERYEAYGLIWMFYIVTGQTVNSCLAVIALIDRLQYQNQRKLDISIMINFGVGISSFVITAIMNQSIKKFIKQIVTEDMDDETQINNNNNNMNQSFFNSNNNRSLLNNIGDRNTQNIIQQNQMSDLINRNHDLSLYQRRNHSNIINQQSVSSKIPKKIFKKTSANILPRFLIQFSNTYFKQYSESKMQSLQNSSRKQQIQQANQKSLSVISPSNNSNKNKENKDNKDNNNLNQNNNNVEQINNDQQDQLSTSSRQKYDAIAAESLATQINQQNNNTNFQVITLQNDEKIIVFDSEESSRKQQFENLPNHDNNNNNDNDDQEEEYNCMSSHSENIKDTASTQTDQNRKRLPQHKLSIQNLEIKYPSPINFLDQSSIIKIRSELNSARVDKIQKQQSQKEDISAQSSAKGENNSCQIQQIRTFKKEECHFYLKSASSTFRDNNNNNSVNLNDKQSIEPPPNIYQLRQNTIQKISLSNIQPLTEDNFKITQNISKSQILIEMNCESIISNNSNNLQNNNTNNNNSQPEIVNISNNNNEENSKNNDSNNKNNIFLQNNNGNDEINNNNINNQKNNSDENIQNKINQKIDSTIQNIQNEENRQKKHTDEESSSCLICFENTQDSVFMECGHGGMCYDCALDIWKITGECYLCRDKIKQILQLDLQYQKNNNNIVKILYITELDNEQQDSQQSSQNPSNLQI